MPVKVDIEDDVFERLQRHAVPLIDSVSSVIARALEALEAGDEAPQPTDATNAGSASRTFNPAAPPNLSYTTPRRAMVAGAVLPRSETYWNPIMFKVIEAAAANGVGAEDLLELLTIPSVAGRKEDAGYRYLATAGISVQGQDANNAWKQAYRIASCTGVDVEVDFIWQDTPKAAMPNLNGSFYVGR